MCFDNVGPSKGGMLKDAKMVMQSRKAKSPMVGNGTGRGGPLGPKSWVNFRSLTRERPMLATDGAANFRRPEVTREASLDVTVAVTVSRVFAVR